MSDRPSQREVHGYFRLMARDDRGAWQRVRGGWFFKHGDGETRRAYRRSLRLSDVGPGITLMLALVLAAQTSTLPKFVLWLWCGQQHDRMLLSDTQRWGVVLTNLALGCLAATLGAGLVVAGIRRAMARGSLLRLTTGHCMVCTYDLLAQIPSNDGCRLCPECGSAWKLPDDARERRLTAPAPRS